MSNHVHDYRMVFDEDASNPLRYAMVCSCGDHCDTMQEAYERTIASREPSPGLRPRDLVAVMFVAGGALFVLAASLARWG